MVKTQLYNNTRRVISISVITILCFFCIAGCFIISFNPPFNSLTAEQQKDRQPQIFNEFAYANALISSDTITRFENITLYSADKNDIEDVLAISNKKLVWVVLCKSGCNYFEENIPSILNVYNNVSDVIDIKFLSADSWFVTIAFKRNLFNHGYKQPLFTLDINTYSPEYDFDARCKKIINEFDPTKGYIVDDVDGINYNLIFDEQGLLIEVIPGFITEEMLRNYLK